MPLDSVARVRIQADDETQAAIAAATARLKTFQLAGSEAGAGLTRNFYEARGSAALLGEEVGVRLNRHLRSILATSSLLGPLLESAFPIAAAIGFGEIIFQAGKRIYDFASGAKEAGDAVKKLVDHFKELEKANAKSNERIGELSKGFGTIGVSGSASGVIKIQQLGQELERVRAAMRANEDQSFGLSREWDRLTDSNGKLITSQAQAGAEARRLAVEHGRLSTIEAELVQEQFNLEKQTLADRFKETDSTARSLAQTIESVKEHMRQMAVVGEQNTATYHKLEAGLARVTASAAGFKQEAAALLKANPEFKTGAERAVEYAAKLDKASAAAAKLADTLGAVIKSQRELNLRAEAFLPANVRNPLRRGATFFDLTDDKQKWKDEIAKMDDAIFAASHPKFELMKTLNQSLTNSFDTMFGDIALGTRGVSQAFTSMAASIAASIFQAVAKMLILAPLLRLISSLLGSFTGGVQLPLFSGRSLPLGPGDFALGPPHAMGGPVMPNMAYMTGELGPELFVPRTAGTIVPNSGLGGAQIVNKVVVVNQTSQPVSAQVGKSVFNGKEYVTNVILQDFASNGPIRRALGS